MTQLWDIVLLFFETIFINTLHSQYVKRQKRCDYKRKWIKKNFYWATCGTLGHKMPFFPFLSTKQNFPQFLAAPSNVDPHLNVC